MPEIKDGDVIEVPEGFWAFGTGVLRLRVTAAGPPRRRDGGIVWQELQGVELDSLGRDRSYLPRTATVRLDRVCWRSDHS